MCIYRGDTSSEGVQLAYVGLEELPTCVYTRSGYGLRMVLLRLVVMRIFRSQRRYQQTRLSHRQAVDCDPEKQHVPTQVWTWHVV